MLQGVGPRFDFHINKTLCDLRFVNDFGSEQATLRTIPELKKFSI